MENFTKEEIEEALRAINSLLSKCEKVKLKIKQGTSQWSLLNNRIKALRISSSLLTKELNTRISD